MTQVFNICFRLVLWVEILCIINNLISNSPTFIHRLHHRSSIRHSSSDGGLWSNIHYLPNLIYYLSITFFCFSIVTCCVVFIQRNDNLWLFYNLSFYWLCSGTLLLKFLHPLIHHLHHFILLSHHLCHLRKKVW